jgi:hypothetical protein
MERGMKSKICIALATVAAVTLCSSAVAMARGGGGHGGGGHGGGIGGFAGHAGLAGGMGFAPGRAGGFRGMAGRPLGLHGDRFAFARRPFLRNRFAFFGGVYPYPYYSDGCYSRVWTPWGWRWNDLCY